MSILVVGTVAFDTIETPFGKTDKIVGGAATYICLSSSFFSNKINLVSVVGEDFPKQAIKTLKNKKINTKGLQIKKGEKTFFWSGKYHNNMNNRDTIETQLNVLETFNPIIPAEFQESEFLMLGNLMPSVQQKVLDQMTKRPKLIVLDTMNFWMDLFMDVLKTALKNIDVLGRSGWESQQWSAIAGAEHISTRANVGMFDLTPFTKLELTGTGSLEALEYNPGKNRNRKATPRAV